MDIKTTKTRSTNTYSLSFFSFRIPGMPRPDPFLLPILTPHLVTMKFLSSLAEVAFWVLRKDGSYPSRDFKWRKDHSSKLTMSTKYQRV